MLNKLMPLFSVMLLACVSHAVARAGVIPMGEFSGEFSEGFESFAAGEIPGPQTNLAGPKQILRGHAMLTGVNPVYPVNPFYIWDSVGGFSIDDLTSDEGHVTAVPFDGTRGLSLQTVISVNPIARIDFQLPVFEFGGYWVHAVTRETSGPISLTFFDEDGATIDSVDFYYDYAHLHGASQWFGWSSMSPIRTIEFTGPWAGVDGIQINTVPEPIALGVAVFMWLVSAPRRKAYGPICRR
jgi:hypothetical protein